MKRLAALPLLAFVAAACVESDAGVRLLAAHPVDAQCVPKATLQTSLGSYALPPAGSTLRGYMVAFDIESTRTPADPGEVGGNPVGETGGGDFLAREQELTYASAPALNLPTQRIPFSYLLREGSTEGNYIIANLLPPAILSVLDAHFAGSAEPVTVTATLKLIGEFRSGRDVETNEVPLSVVVAPASCPAGQRPAQAAGACGLNGQDGALVCEAVPAP